jgi:sarcosine oxidase delta subunit
MTGLARKGEIELDCPFCEKGKVKTFHKEGYRQAHTSRISGRQATRSFQRPETYEVLEDCPLCGKTKKEIQRAFETGKTKEMTHEERIERLKKRGLPLVLGSGK